VIKRLTDRYSPQLTTCTSAQGKLTEISHIRRMGKQNSSSRRGTESIPGTTKMPAIQEFDCFCPVFTRFFFIFFFWRMPVFSGKLWNASLGRKQLKSILAGYQKAVCRVVDGGPWGSFLVCCLPRAIFLHHFLWYAAHSPSSQAERPRLGERKTVHISLCEGELWWGSKRKGVAVAAYTCQIANKLSTQRNRILYVILGSLGQLYL